MRVLVCALLLVGSTSIAKAAIVYGTSAIGELTGTRDLGAPNGSIGGLTATGAGWSSGFELGWTIAPSGSNWVYTYTFSGFTSPDISHITLDISDACIDFDNDTLADPNCVTQINLNSDSNSTGIVGEQEYGNNDGIAGAVKFESLDDLEPNGGNFQLMFTSNQAPVYGHIFLFGGLNTVSNIGLGLTAGDPGLMDTLNFVARPNGDGVGGEIPEPATVVLVGIGLALVAVRMKRRTA